MSGIASTVYWKIDDQKMTNCLKITFYRSRKGSYSPFTHIFQWWESHKFDSLALQYRWRRLLIILCHQHDGSWNKAAWCHGLPSEGIRIIKEDLSTWMHQMHHILLECYHLKSWFCFSNCILQIVAKILCLQSLFKIKLKLAFIWVWIQP